MKFLIVPGLLVFLMIGGFQPNSSQAASTSSDALMGASVNTRLQYWTFDPMVISTSGTQSVLLSIQADTYTPAATIIFEDDGAKQLQAEGNGRFSIELTHDEALVGEYRKYDGRNYVGQLDVNDGNTYPIWVNIDDGTIPEVEVVDLDASTRISPRIVNFLIPHETPAQLDIKSITRLFYQYFPDEFDFINIVSTKASPLDPDFTNVQNATTGLGLDLFDHTSDYGSSGRLEGVVRISNLSHFDLASREYLRMLGHNWMNYSEHSALSNATPHWPISTLASGIMGYHDQVTDGYGWFPYTFEQKLVGFPPGIWEGDYYLNPVLTPPVYNSMERYLMGLIPASRVGGSFILEDQNQNVCFPCDIEGPLIYYSAASLLEALGPRDPDTFEARKNFKTATVVVSSERLLSPHEIRHFDYMAARGEARGELGSSRNDSILGSTHPFRSASGGNGSLDAIIVSNFVANINQGHFGAWFNPATSGQGLMIEIEPASQFMFLGWFAYTAGSSGNPNQQHWLTAQGSYSGNSAVLPVYETLGGKFGDPQAVSTSAIGTLELSFSDCANGLASYTIDTWETAGSFPLSRLIPGSEKVCIGLAEADNTGLVKNDARDGAWYDPATGGQGFFIDVHPNSDADDFIFITWFTYGDVSASGQRWLTAQGPMNGTQANIPLYESTGGSFDDPTAVSTQQIGTMSIKFNNCTSASVTYDLTLEALSGSIDIVRLVPGTGVLCEELAGMD